MAISTTTFHRHAGRATTLHFATARKEYVCARCNGTIRRGTVYARLERPPLTYHTCICDYRRCRCRECAPDAPHYPAENRGVYDDDDHPAAERGVYDTIDGAANGAER